MAKFKADQLHEIIRAIVRQEINEAVVQKMNEVVVKTINEVLSERYLTKLAENVASRPRGVGRTMHIADGDDHDEEGTPQPMRNDDRGIYHVHPSKHDDEVEDDDAGEPQLQAEDLERNEMLSLFFEGTKPLQEVEAQVEEGVPLERITEMRRDNDGRQPIQEVWKTLAGVKKPAQAQQTSRPVDTAALEAREEARLKQLRESLETPVR